MARKIITLCDPHLTEHDEEVPGEPYRLGVETPGGRWVWIEIDLCEADAAEMAQFSAWLDKYGREFSGPEGVKGKRPYTRRQLVKSDGGDGESSASSDALKCPACEYVGTTKSSLASHAKRIHKQTVSQLRGDAADFVCEECGAAFTRSQSLGVHRKSKHPAS